jgi:hypothetical protein
LDVSSEISKNTKPQLGQVKEKNLRGVRIKGTNVDEFLLLMSQNRLIVHDG